MSVGRALVTYPTSESTSVCTEVNAEGESQEHLSGCCYRLPAGAESSGMDTQGSFELSCTGAVQQEGLMS
ncbi:hypothetical protein Y1Q_0001098 [Alligator mississippiensis]|uniref:Uncharacterized protein n=1 Tax=Alligator mississippiensis TaxID=8496 RepID=A0A151NZ92_ALLMI|nr:hypothetical protein Y1Q_0001098 [Alligator mississippiensis]